MDIDAARALYRKIYATGRLVASGVRRRSSRGESVMRVPIRMQEETSISNAVCDTFATVVAAGIEYPHAFAAGMHFVKIHVCNEVREVVSSLLDNLSCPGIVEHSRRIVAVVHDNFEFIGSYNILVYYVDIYRLGVDLAIVILETDHQGMAFVQSVSVRVDRA